MIVRNQNRVKKQAKNCPEQWEGQQQQQQALIAKYSSPTTTTTRRATWIITS